MNFILFDNFRRNNLLPLTYIRPVADIRIGILTIREKWEWYLKKKTSTLTEKYLARKYPVIEDSDNIMINGSVCPNEGLVARVLALKPNEVLVSEDTILAMRVEPVELMRMEEENSEDTRMIEAAPDFIKVNYTWDIFSKNGDALRQDFKLITKGRRSQAASSTNRIIGDQLFIEEGARMEGATINTLTGPVYVAKDAEIMEGSMIRGPFSLGQESTVKMGAKIYGPTTIGPGCKIGGEVNNSVFFGHSNKAHDGFMGQSVIAEWCNIGADTNTSNLKNTYDSVKIWNYGDQTFIDTGLLFCGLIMGDHSKCGINTMFNTGTVIGVNSNIYGSGYQRNFIPNFAWGGPAGMKSYDINKAIDVAKRVYERREIIFDEIEQEILRAVHSLTIGSES
jgi:UDP-N-acetylglucosamine diphosphorylase/glucosamine-1-phosphate N-acetyltransferase